MAIKLRIGFWLRAFRLTVRWSAGLSAWCMTRLAVAEADQWVRNVERMA